MLGQPLADSEATGNDQAGAHADGRQRTTVRPSDYDESGSVQPLQRKLWRRRAPSEVRLQRWASTRRAARLDGTWAPKISFNKETVAAHLAKQAKNMSKACVGDGITPQVLKLLGKDSGPDCNRPRGMGGPTT